MSTVLTIYVKSYHIFLSPARILKLSHACILPRVFDCVGKNNIFSCDIQATIAINKFLNCWLSDLISKNWLAIGNPVSFIDKIGSERVLFVGHLEPTQFSTELPSPLTHILVIVNIDIWKTHPIIVTQFSLSYIVSILFDNWKL